MSRPDRERLLALARRRGWLSAQEVARAGIHSQHLTVLVADGTLERVRRGLYRIAGSEVTQHHGLVVASAAVPGAVICLLSALSFHAIGTQLPAEVWIAIARGRREPKLPYPRLRVVRYSGAAFSEGIEIHELEARRVKVYSVAKTIADLFKARHQVGLDVAMEALREAWRARRFTMAELDRAARACRVERVMRPYVEAISA
ncbi:MAG: type IV toxin-antitoxin system AbiEi family antitoxin domain-containing protein [Thermoanaerobaculia bacterium]|nr:type IV toxin-antitoxin system AbiEi family antitoxin domain-containing protein [Thermoanaerobaculia bacterium]